MNWSITQELKQTFHLHALRHEASHQLTGRQWEKYSALKTRCQSARNQEKRLFDKRYDARMTQEYRKLLHERNSKVKEFKPVWAQNDSFDRSALLAQSDKSVRRRHEQRLNRIDKFEARETQSLLHRSGRVNQQTGKSEQAFNRSADRRLGNDRRSIQGNQQTRPFQRQSR